MVDIFQAISNRSYANIMRAIRERESLNCRDDQGTTPLSLAVSLEDPAAVEILLESGADVNFPNGSGETPLCLAVQKTVVLERQAWAPVVRLDAHEAQDRLHKIIIALLGQGADINKACVLARGDEKLLRALIEGSSQKDTPDDNGSTPLLLIIENGVHRSNSDFYGRSMDYTEDIVSLLITKGADVNHVDNNGNTPLSLAINQGKTELVALLVEKGANVHYADNQGKTPLQLAIERNMQASIAILKKQGAKINYTSSSPGREVHSRPTTDTSLLAAIEAASLETVENFLKEGVRLNVMEVIPNIDRLCKKSRNRFIANAPRYAKDFLTCLLRALENAEGWEVKDRQGRSVLHLLAEKYQYKSFLQLFSKAVSQIDVNCQDSKGQTPLHLCVIHYDESNRGGGIKMYDDSEETTEMLPLLLKHGANPNIQDNEGQTPLHLAGNIKFTSFISGHIGDTTLVSFLLKRTSYTL